jgi:hypothetical protein
LKCDVNNILLDVSEVYNTTLRNLAGLLISLRKIFTSG